MADNIVITVQHKYYLYCKSEPESSWSLHDVSTVTSAHSHGLLLLLLFASAHFSDIHKKTLVEHRFQKTNKQKK